MDGSGYMTDKVKNKSLEADPSKSLRPLLDPKNIAVIGASSDLTRIGGRPIKNLLDFNYKGTIFPVNPKRTEIAGLPCYPHISGVPGEIDLALIVVPAPMVLKTVKDCAQKGVRSLIVVSSGFAEAGEEGKKIQDEMTRIARESKMRVLGPNTVGMFNVLTGAFANFGISRSMGTVPKGRIGIVSQSGALCAYLYTLAVEQQIGLSYFIGTGNEADVDVADCISYLAEDPDTDVIACYMEGTRNGEKLLSALNLAKQRKKPVIVLKVGRSAAGRLAIASHTASLVGSDDVFDTIYKEAGAYRVESIQELLDIAWACSFGPLPRGKRVAIFSISGGAGVMLADQLTERGLILPQPDEEIQKQLKQLVPYASVLNPIDFTAQLLNDPKLLVDFMKNVLDRVPYDMVVTFTSTQGYYPMMTEKILDAIREVREAHPHIPHLLTSMTVPETRKMIREAGIPVYNDPIRMAKAGAALFRIAEFMQDSAPQRPRWEKKVRDLSVYSHPTLTEAASKEILRDYGIPVTREKMATAPEEAIQIANEIGYPVVLKGMSPQIPHKTEAGLVHLQVRSDAEVAELFSKIKESIAKVNGAECSGVLVQEMLKPPFVEMIVGSKFDPVFGPMVMVGMGGIFVEVLRDVSIRRAPVSEEQAMAMLRELRGFHLLEGARNQPPADTEALCAIIAALSRLAADYGDAAEEIDVNPVAVYARGKGAKAADALIKRKGGSNGGEMT
jgi:acetyltransferase